jgi:hypothetical protein
MSQRIAQRNADRFIGEKRAFHATALVGVSGAHHSAGRMDSPWREKYEADADLGVISYTVVSYATPIAWFKSDIGAWVFPQGRYSVTSSRHQNAVLKALVGQEVVYI